MSSRPWTTAARCCEGDVAQGIRSFVGLASNKILEIVDVDPQHSLPLIPCRGDLMGDPLPACCCLSDQDHAA